MPACGQGTMMRTGDGEGRGRRGEGAAREGGGEEKGRWGYDILGGPCGRAMMLGGQQRGFQAMRACGKKASEGMDVKRRWDRGRCGQGKMRTGEDAGTGETGAGGDIRDGQGETGAGGDIRDGQGETGAGEDEGRGRGGQGKARKGKARAGKGAGRGRRGQGKAKAGEGRRKESVDGQQGRSTKIVEGAPHAEPRRVRPPSVCLRTVCADSQATRPNVPYAAYHTPQRALCSIPHAPTCLMQHTTRPNVPYAAYHTPQRALCSKAIRSI
ncbi:unnamed protein product [Closterium sp. Naga37s-1]|nr:unnamed protein product [Closterium sp. Naga37s-1]